MKRISIVIGVVSLLIFNSLVSLAQEEKWKQIIVMKSTKSEVDRLLGKTREGINSNEAIAFYDVETGGITVYYSMRLCEPNDRGGWNIEKGIVYEVTYDPVTQPSFKSLKIDKKKFKKELAGDTDDLSYTNMEDGIKYLVRDGKVRSITYFPGKKFDNLQCEVVNNLKN